ncbi:MAG: hypothetical protein ABTD50_12625 [Polyangiaceae bacterium]
MSGRSGRRWGGAGRWLGVPAILVGLAVASGASADGSEQSITHRCAVASQRAQACESDAKLRDAHTELARCSEPICPWPIRDECLQRLARVDAKLPTVVLAAKDTDGSDLSAVRVIVDGEPFAERADGKPLPIDPGEHHVVFQAAGLPSVEATWVIMQGEKDRRERVVFASPTPRSLPAGPAPPVFSMAPAPALATQPVAAIVAAPARPQPFWNSAWFWGAIGAAALVGGAIYLSSGADNGPNTIHLQMQVPH